MPSTINIIENLTELTANLIPFRVEYDGPASTKEYFTPSKSMEKYGQDDVEVAYFRGYRMIAQEEPLPKNYQGYVMETSENVEEVEGTYKTTNKYDAIGKFDKLVIYGHGSLPAHNQWNLIDEWVQLNEVIHC